MLVLQGGVYHYRRVVPRALRAPLGRREVWISLKTPYRRMAESRAVRFNGLVEGVFVAAKKKLYSSLSDELGDDPRGELIRILRETFHEQSVTLETLQQNHSIELEARKIEALTTRIQRSTESNTSLHRLKAELDVVLPEVSQLAAKVQKYGLKDDETLKLAAALNAGLSRVEDISLKLEIIEKASRIHQDDRDSSEFSAYIESFFVWRHGFGKVSHQVMGQERGTLLRFIERQGDKPVNRYTRSDVVKFLETLRRLPKSYGKSPKDKIISLEEIIKRTKDGTERLTDKTVKRHLSVLSQFFRFVVDNGGLQMSQRNELVEKHSFRGSDLADNQQRQAWSMADLKVLFASEVWSADRQRDSKFWLPLLALFHGARLEEFADLRRADVFFEKESGLHAIRIIDYETEEGRQRKLKTRASKRTIPIHPEILRLGFLDYVSAVAKTPAAPLFPDMAPQGADGKRGPRLTRWFVNYRRKHKVYHKGVGMHAFRHLLTTTLKNEITDERQKRSLDYLTGHAAQGSEGSIRYDKGPGLKLVYETLALLEYPELDFRHLYV